MANRYLPLHLTDTAYWALLTCAKHRAGDVEIQQQGAFIEVRSRECAREAEAEER
jgi:hypothetical protein